MSPEDVSSSCKCHFSMVNECVLNHMCNFQVAEENVC